MVLFSKKQNTKEEKKKTKAEASPHTSLPAHLSAQAEAGASVPHNFASRKHAGAILFSPRITEKGAYVAEKGVYVFNVARTANKKEIARAVQEIFKVTPIQVRTAHIPSKRTSSRVTRRMGKTAAGKKAYVYVKKGDKIELV